MGVLRLMRDITVKTLALFAMVLTLSACGDKEPQLMNLKATQSGPDEFSILPTKPLQEPESYKALPAPTPGGANRSDVTPMKDAVAALGGRPDRLDRTGIRSGEAGVVNYASRHGVSGSIRNQLAAEDLEWRRDNKGRLLERLFNVNVYYRAYTNMHLDQNHELERLRRLGVWTPSAPPQVVN